MTPRLATLDDVPDIAAIHVQAWQETYPGLVPASEITRRDIAQRMEVWGRVIGEGMPVSYLPGVGFAQVGRNRDETLRDAYPLELYSFYTLKNAHGSGAGQALLQHALRPNPQPFMALALKGNARALRFYEKIGGTPIKEIRDVTDDWTYIDIVLGFAVPIQL